MMNIETRQAYSEVNQFLKLIGEKKSNKIPFKLRKFFEREMDKNYIPTIDANIPIKEQKLKRKTIAIIAGLNLQYWCKEDEKQKLLEIYFNNENKYKKELQEKYNPNDIFKKNIKSAEEDTTSTENMQLSLVEEDKWYKKILKKISNFFKKRK